MRFKLLLAVFIIVGLSSIGIGEAMWGSGSTLLSNYPPPPVASQPSGLTPPPQASAAGFTTLLANFDWSNNQLCIATNCVAASPMSNWLDCVGNDETKFLHPYGTIPACNVAVGIDPSNGFNAMILTWLPSYPPGQAVQFSLHTSGGSGSFSFPQGFYVESSYRLASTWAANSPFGSNAPYIWQNTTDCVMDFQLGELEQASNGVASSDASIWCPPAQPGNHLGEFIWQTFSSNSLPPGWAVTGRHTYGALRTTNGVSPPPPSIVNCAYVDNILQIGPSNGCFDTFSIMTNQSNVEHTARSFFIMAADASAQNPPAPPANTVIYYYWIRVWSCSGGASGECNGSTLVGTPGVNLGTGNGQVAYWH